MSYNHGKNKKHAQQIHVASFFCDRFIHEQVNKHFEGFEHIAEMNESQEFDKLNIVVVLVVYYWWKRCDHVKYKVAF